MNIASQQAQLQQWANAQQQSLNDPYRNLAYAQMAYPKPENALGQREMELAERNQRNLSAYKAKRQNFDDLRNAEAKGRPCSA